MTAAIKVFRCERPQNLSLTPSFSQEMYSSKTELNQERRYRIHTKGQIQYGKEAKAIPRMIKKASPRNLCIRPRGPSVQTEARILGRREERKCYACLKTKQADKETSQLLSLGKIKVVRERKCSH